MESLSHTNSVSSDKGTLTNYAGMFFLTLGVFFSRLFLAEVKSKWG